MTREPKLTLPADFNLPSGVSEVKGKDPGTFLQFNTHMVTFYQQTYGELSRFFLAIRDAKLIGSRCSKCEQVLVPPATWHCPACSFADMEEVELPHRGTLAATAPITIFPSASFIGQAPFCRGYVDVATDAPIASFLPARLRTTTGLPRPGIFVKGAKLALVFKQHREGTIRDFFFVPLSEVPKDLLDKKPLFAKDLSFAAPKAPEVKRDSSLEEPLRASVEAMRRMAAKIEGSPRAQKDLAGRTHAVAFKTGGGDFALHVEGSRIRIEDRLPDEPDFTAVTDDPGIFGRWVDDGSLTDAAVEGTLWLPDRRSFALLPILDRLPRSVRRDVKD